MIDCGYAVTHGDFSFGLEMTLLNIAEELGQPIEVFQTRTKKHNAIFATHDVCANQVSYLLGAATKPEVTKFFAAPSVVSVFVDGQFC